MGHIFGTGDMTLLAHVNAPAAAAYPQTVAALSTGDHAVSLRLYVEATTGRAKVTYWNGWEQPPAPAAPVITHVTGTTTVANGRTHALAVTVTTAGLITLYVDGVAQASVTAPDYTARANFSRLSVAGAATHFSYDGPLTGSVSHVAGYLWHAFTAAEVAEHWQAGATGFSGERTDQRLARVLAWVGLPTAFQALDTGQSRIGHIDTTGARPLDVVRRIEQTEQGLVLVDTQGRIAFLARNRFYGSTPVTVPASLLAPDASPVMDLYGVVNDLTISRPSGSSVRVVDTDSQAAYGVFAEAVELVLTSDDELLAAAQWARTVRGSTPTVRWPAMAFDALIDPSPGAVLRGIDIADRIQVTGLPAQAPATVADVTVIGASHTITAAAWVRTFNVGAYGALTALIADDPTGATVAGGPGVAVY